MSKGFTLIECLVALLIVAVVLASASRALGMIIHDVHDSYVREVATWIAENEYNEYNIRAVYPEVGIKDEKITFAGVNFNLKQKVIQTANPYFRRIEISISETETPNYVIFKTVNFIAQY